MSEKVRKEFENHPRFKGMDFHRSATHPEFYESPYANGAWDGYQAGRPTAPKEEYCDRMEGCVCGGDTVGVRSTCSYWVKV